MGIVRIRDATPCNRHTHICFQPKSFLHIIPIIKFNPIYLENRSLPVLFCSWLSLEHTHTYTHTHTHTHTHRGICLHDGIPSRQPHQTMVLSLMVASSECSSNDDLNSPLNLTSPHSPILGHPSFRICSDSLSSFFLPQTERTSAHILLLQRPYSSHVGNSKTVTKFKPNCTILLFFFFDT